jgi:3-hydroxybutyryl-CoA dehydratase
VGVYPLLKAADVSERRGANLKGKTIEELQIGLSARFSKTITEADVYLFAGITGDLNPAHVDEEFAKNTFFKTRIAHGMLTAGFISTIIGTMLPGPGSIYIRQEVNFLKPVRIGDTVTATAEVAEVMAEKKRVRLNTFCTNQNGEVVLDGLAIVSPPRRSFSS